MGVIQELIDTLHDSNAWQRQIELRRSEYLIAKGETKTDFYLIEEGTIRIFIADDDTEHTIRFGYSGEIICALDSFFSNQPTDFYIQAIKKSRLQSISKSKFYEIINGSEKTKAVWGDVLGSFIIQQIEREKDLLIESPLERYKKVFSRSPHLFQEVPHKYIASYLRMTPETLSRLKKS